MLRGQLEALMNSLAASTDQSFCLARENGMLAARVAALEHELQMLQDRQSTPAIDGPPGTDILRAEAMTAYTRSLLEPLVGLVQQQGTTIREQAAELEARATAHSSGASDRTPWVLAALASVGVVVLFVALVVVLLSRW
jgi:hypothetical protein